MIEEEVDVNPIPLPSREECIRESLRMLDYAKDTTVTSLRGSVEGLEERDWWMAKAQFWATLAVAASPSHSNTSNTIFPNRIGTGTVPEYVDEDMRP